MEGNLDFNRDQTFNEILPLLFLSLKYQQFYSQEVQKENEQLLEDDDSDNYREPHHERGYG